MIAQAYFNDNEMTIRIFQSRNSKAIAELPLEKATDKSANESLRKIGMVKRERWQKRDWGKEAKVRFNRPAQGKG